MQVKQQQFKAEISWTNLLTNVYRYIDADLNRNQDILMHTITFAINKQLSTKTNLIFFRNSNHRSILILPLPLKQLFMIKSIWLGIKQLTSLAVLELVDRITQ